MSNEIIDEVRTARAAFAAEHGHDLCRIQNWAIAAQAAREKATRPRSSLPSIVTSLRSLFPSVVFEETLTDSEFLCDVDFMGWADVAKTKAFGLQIRHLDSGVTVTNFTLSERMRHSFEDFQKKYQGSVVVLFNQNGRIANPEALQTIQSAINTLTS